MKKDNFEIHDNYKHRKNENFLNTTKRTDEYQDVVYKLSLDVLNENNYKSIVDIGCGSGFKLLKYFSNFDTLGLDLKETVNFLNKKYPNKKWGISDFNKKLDKEYDLLICADVIEHLLNPNDLINWIKMNNPKSIIISTPDRNLLVKNRKRSNDGPPGNVHHIREWSFEEFNKYISRYFDIILHNNIIEEDGQVIYCKIKK